MPMGGYSAGAMYSRASGGRASRAPAPPDRLANLTHEELVGLGREQANRSREVAGPRVLRELNESQRPEVQCAAAFEMTQATRETMDLPRESEAARRAFVAECVRQPETVRICLYMRPRPRDCSQVLLDYIQEHRLNASAGTADVGGSEGPRERLDSLAVQSVAPVTLRGNDDDQIRSASGELPVMVPGQRSDEDDRLDEPVGSP